MPLRHFFLFCFLVLPLHHFFFLFCFLVLPFSALSAPKILALSKKQQKKAYLPICPLGWWFEKSDSFVVHVDFLVATPCGLGYNTKQFEIYKSSSMNTNLIIFC